MKLIRFYKILLLSFVIALYSCNNESLTLSSKNDTLKFEFNKDGSFKGILDNVKGNNYLDLSMPSYLMSIILPALDILLLSI